MNIAELITEVGVENVGIQYLDQCADKLNWDAKRGARITFGSDQTVSPNGTDKFGIVVWLDRDAVKAALDKARAA